VTTRPTRIAALLLALLCSAQGSAQTPPTPPRQASGSAAEAEMQPRFIWGMLLNAAVKVVASLFMDWLEDKLTTELTPQNLGKLYLNSLTASILPVRDAATPGVAAKATGAPINTVSGDPTAAFSYKDGQVNYQGVNVALLGFDRNGLPTGLRALGDGFRTGERFKLKLLPTFDGLLVIEAISPGGQRDQIYPPGREQVVAVKAGTEILVPLDRDQYFEFTGIKGDEQLVLSLRDPRAFGDAATPAPAFRKDEAHGSNLLQETPAGTYPLIAQTLRLRHE
jgi:hypothetical protein